MPNNPFLSFDPSATSAVTGSPLARTFLRDCIAGTDSLDIVTIGDSNACSPAAYGYTQGLNRALGYSCGVPLYASPLLSCGPHNPDTPNTAQWDTGLYTTGLALKVSPNGYASGGGLGTTLKKLVVGSSLSAELISLQNFLYTTTAGYEVDATTPLLKVANYQWMPVCVNTGDTWRSDFGQTNSIFFDQTSTLGKVVSSGLGSQPMAGRIIYGTFATGSGEFHLTARDTTASALLNSAEVLTNTGSVGYSTAQLNFTSPSDVTHSTSFAWDGANQGPSKDTIGPACFLWASVCKLATKGYSVSNLVGYGGSDTNMISDSLVNSTQGTRSFLGELKNRQIACGGSGRVLVWINAGINLESFPSTWVANMTLMVNHIRDQWSAVGGNGSSISFVISVSHPVTQSSAPGTAWFTERPAFAQAAWDWGTRIGGGVTVIDLATLYPPRAMLTGDLTGNRGSGTLYDSASQLHLRSTVDTATNGYDAMTFAAINAITH